MQKNRGQVLRITRTLCLITLISVSWPSLAASDALVFFHSPGCIYCEDWRAEIMPIYPKTAEGQRLELIEVNIDDPIPERFQHLKLPNFTPTFAVIDDQDREVGRILGYNEEFFWGFVQALIKKLDDQSASTKKSGS